jgi:hypothetical protein
LAWLAKERLVKAPPRKAPKGEVRLGGEVRGSTELGLAG